MAEINISLEDLISRMGSIDKQYLLEEAARRAEYFFRQTDGTYSFQSHNGQITQIVEMLIAAANKTSG